MSDEQAQMQPERARVFLIDGTNYDCILGAPWAVFLHEYITNGCIMTGEILIEREGVMKIVRLLPPTATPVTNGSNILTLIPKGSA